MLRLNLQLDDALEVMTDKKYHEKPENLRSIRSFVKREGKLTKGQKNAIDTLWPSFGVNLVDQKLDFPILFQRSAPVVLEIGFGNGFSLTEMADKHRDTNFFGVEVHMPGVGSLLVQVKKRELQNVRVSHDDAVQVLEQQIPDESLDRVQIFFPDPWHKKRHHKRRLIQTEFVETLIKKLKPQGHIHVATDWENYAEHIAEVLLANKQLKNILENSLAVEGALQADGHGSLLTRTCVPKPSYRPNTKYEARGIRLGHGVWDIIFEKRDV